MKQHKTKNCIENQIICYNGEETKETYSSRVFVCEFKIC